MESSLTIEFGSKFIDTTVTCTGTTVTNWIRDISARYRHLQNVVVGLDIEWKPNRRWKEDNVAATLQLSIGGKCLIVQLIHLDYIPRSLKRFLFNMRYVFVGVGVESDVAKLVEDYGLVCRRHCDVRKVALDTWQDGRFSRQPGLKELAEVVAGIWLEKRKCVTLSNWEKEVLSDEQIEYACLDAYASFMIGMKLRKKF